MKICLASTSPRRQDLLSSLGIPFEVVSPKFVEEPTEMSPEDEVLYFAGRKARSVSSDLKDALIIGSDTLVVCEGRKLGKPRDESDAVSMLTRLSGRAHEVLTAVVLLNTIDGSLKTMVGKADVYFRVLTAEEIMRYVATGEPMDKAGAYAIQGKGRDFVEKVVGDWNTVIGLPLTPLKEWLHASSHS